MREPDQIDMMNEHELRDELRKLIARPPAYTIDEIEEWLLYLCNVGEIAWVNMRLRDERFGLAGHRRRETWLHDTPASG